MSADGTKLAAVEFFGNIWTSIDSGGTWTPYKQAGVDTLRGWSNITMSADGTKLAAVAFFNTIWTSTNSGGTWTPSKQDDVVGKPWRDITMSADGTKLAAVEDDENGTIWTSIDSGGTWTPSEQDDVVGKPWRAIASSSGVWGQETMAGPKKTIKAFKLGGVGQLGTAALKATVNACTSEKKITFSRCGTALAAHQAVIRAQAGLETINPEQVPLSQDGESVLNALVGAYVRVADQVSKKTPIKEIPAIIFNPPSGITIQIVYLGVLSLLEAGWGWARQSDFEAIKKWATDKGHGTFGTSEDNQQIVTALFTECVKQYTGYALLLKDSPFPSLGYVISPDSINAVLGITTYVGPDTTKVPYNDYIGPRDSNEAALQDLMDFFITEGDNGGLNFKQYGHGSTRYSITDIDTDDPGLSYRSLITSNSTLTPTDLGSHINYVKSVAFNHDGSVLASGSYKSIKLWRMSDNTLITTLAGHASSVSSVAFNHDGTVLASGSDDKTIKLWRMSDNTLIKTFKGYGSSVSSVAFNHDGSVLASGSYNGTIKLWRMSDNTLITTLTGHANDVESVAFNHDGSVLASGSDDKTIKLWRMSDNTLIKTFKGYGSYVFSVAFNHDGSVLASGSLDGTIKLWRMSDNTFTTLTGHADSVLSVAFNHDGSVLASGSDDDTIKLWRMSDNTEIATLSGHTSSVYSVAFNHDGSVLASTGGLFDKTIKLWSESQELVKLRDTKLYLPIYEGVLGTFPLTIGDIDYLTIDSKNETEDPDDTNIFLNVYFERLNGDTSTSDPRLDYYLGQGGLVSVNLQNPDFANDESGTVFTTPGDAKPLYEKVKAQKITSIFISTSTTSGTTRPPKLDITLFNASLKVNECDKPFNIAFTKDDGPVITSGRTATVETSELTLYETTVAGGQAPYTYTVKPGDIFTIDADGVVTVSKPLPVGEQTLMVEVTDLNGEMATKDVALDVYRKLVADKDDAAAYDNFGYSVAISGDTIVVGAYGDNNNDKTDSGSAYVFERSENGTWSETKLVADDAATNDYFGNSVAISGDTIVVGAYGDNNNDKTDSGSAYVFERSENGTWSETKLVADDAATNDYFGNSVAISGGTIVVGSYKDDNNDKTDSGSAYVYGIKTTPAVTSGSQGRYLFKDYNYGRVVYKTTVVGGKGLYTYTVSSGDLEIEIEIDATGVVTVSKPLAVGQYTFTVAASDEDGSVATQDVTFYVYATELNGSNYAVISGNRSLESLITTIGDFSGYTEGAVTINGDEYPMLKTITDSAFRGFTGTLTMLGEFPKLETIGEYAFAGTVESGGGSVNLTGLSALTTIGPYAFFASAGKLTISGIVPSLATIGKSAFEGNGRSDNIVNLTGLSALTTIGPFAFFVYTGTLIISGIVPSLATIGEGAFDAHAVSGSLDNIVNLTGLSALTTIGPFAIHYFRGTLTISGIVPLLATIGDYAFNGSGNTDSSVTFDKELPASLLSIGTTPFLDFEGQVFMDGNEISKDRLNAGWPNK